MTAMSPRTRSDIVAAASGWIASLSARKMLEAGERDATVTCLECDCDMGPIIGPEDDGTSEARRVLLDALEFAIEHARAGGDPVADEREACAVAVESLGEFDAYGIRATCAAAIRARSTNGEG
jgi:hypothetical protein